MSHKILRGLACLFVNTALLQAQCGIGNQFSIYVQKSAHRDSVTVPDSACRTASGPCKASGTVYIVSSKKVKYTIFLVDGTTGNLDVGETYSSFVTCGKQPMMVIGKTEHQAQGTFYILEQEVRQKGELQAPPRLSRFWLCGQPTIHR